MVVFNLMFSIYKDQCGPSIKHLFYLKIVYTFLLMIAAVLNAHMWQVSLVPIISSIGGVLCISLIASLDAIKPIICRIYILLTKNVKNLQFVTLEQSKFCRIQDIGICYSKLLLDSGKVKIISTRKLVKNTIYKISGNQEVIKKNIEFKFPTNDISDHQYETIKQEILYQLKADFNLNQSQVVFRLSREDLSRRHFFVYVETRFNSQSMKKNQFLDIFFSHELYVSKLRKAIFSIILKHYRYPLTQQRLEKYQ